MRTVYQINRKACGERGHNQDLTVKAKDGSTINKVKAKLERWWEHFQQLLKRCDPPTHTDISEAEHDLDVELGPITIQGVKDAIKTLMNCKATGDDKVHAEMLKADEQDMPQLLEYILLDVWDIEVTPDAWKIGTIIKLPKIGNLSECSNWRGITLLSITSKAFTASFSNASQQQWTNYYAKNKQASGRENHTSTTSLSFV